MNSLFWSFKICILFVLFNNISLAFHLKRYSLSLSIELGTAVQSCMALAMNKNCSLMLYALGLFKWHSKNFKLFLYGISAIKWMWGGESVAGWVSKCEGVGGEGGEENRFWRLGGPRIDGKEWIVRRSDRRRARFVFRFDFRLFHVTVIDTFMVT